MPLFYLCPHAALRSLHVSMMPQPRHEAAASKRGDVAAASKRGDKADEIQ